MDSSTALVCSLALCGISSPPLDRGRAGPVAGSRPDIFSSRKVWGTARPSFLTRRHWQRELPGGQLPPCHTLWNGFGSFEVGRDRVQDLWWDERCPHAYRGPHGRLPGSTRNSLVGPSVHQEGPPRVRAGLRSKPPGRCNNDALIKREREEEDS